MGYRIPQVRELDPSQTRIQPQIQQVMQGTPYWEQMMQADRQNADRQNQMNMQRGQYEAQKAAADINKGNAWIGALDRGVSSVLPAAQAFHGMGLENKKFQESQKTGEANRANLMEQTLGLRAKNELDMMYGAKERQAGLGMTEAQTKGIGITNEQGQLALQKAQREEQFANADAAQAGFEKANPGETIASYTMRMAAIGDIAKVKLVEAQAKREGLEADFLPRRLSLEEKTANANIENARASAANARVMAGIAQRQDTRAAEQQNFDMKLAKQNEAAKRLDQFITGIESGTLTGGRPINEEQKQMLIQNEATNLVKTFDGDASEIAPFLAGAVTRYKSNLTAAKVAENVRNQQSPETKILIDQNIKQQQKLTTANELLTNLKAVAEGYKAGAGKGFNSDEAKFKANQIQVALDNAKNQVPEFAPFAEQFRKINASFAENPLQAVQNIFAPTIEAQTDALMKSISQYVLNDVGAGGPIHPSMLPGITTLTKMVQTTSSDLNDMAAAAAAAKARQINMPQSMYVPTNGAAGGRR